MLYEQVHVWKIELNRWRTHETALWALLSSTEQTQAAQFYFPHDRMRYIFSHGGSRLILSRYLSIAPQQIVLDATPEGKPFIQQPTESTLHFNLTHAGDLAYVAVADGPVGIDIEQIDATIPYAELITQFMSPAEQARFRALPAEQQTAAFYHVWTRKEAYVKAIGRGLSYPIREVTVSLSPEQIDPWTDAYDPAERARWRMFSLEVPDRYVGAVVGQGNVVGLGMKCLQPPSVGNGEG